MAKHEETVLFPVVFQWSFVRKGQFLKILKFYAVFTNVQKVGVLKFRVQRRAQLLAHFSQNLKIQKGIISTHKISLKTHKETWFHHFLPIVISLMSIDTWKERK